MKLERLALGVIPELLQQGATDALGKTARDLPRDKHRIDGPADVVGHGVSVDDHFARPWVDLDCGDVDAVGEAEQVAGKPRLLADRASLRPEQLRQRDLS
jgi:hypothetical protein